MSNNFKTSIVFINVKKNHKYRIGTDKHGLAISFNDFGLLLPHTTPFGANPLKVDQKFHFENGKEKTWDITMEDLGLLYDLTKLNYSTLYGEWRSFKLPAPIHYADRFLKAVRRGWEVDQDLLSEGCLYFI